MTEWWAFKPVKTAFDKTRKLLLEPFNAWTWIKLIIIVFFVGTGASKLSSVFTDMTNYRTGGNAGYPYSLRQQIQYILSDTTLLAIIVGLIVLAIIIGLVLLYLRNVFSFVLIRALVTGDARVIRPMLDNLGRGFRLFVFTLALTIFTAVVDAILVGIMVAGFLLAIRIGLASVGSAIGVALLACVLIAIFLIFIAFTVAMLIFLGFTYDFVAPMVLFKNVGAFQAWKQLWASIKKEWKQYGVYVLTRWVVELAVTILLMFIALPIVLIFAALFVVGAIAAFTVASTSIWAAIALGLLLFILLLAMVIVMMIISMPVAVYFRYYSLDVLKLIDPSAVTYADKFTFPPPEQGKLPP